MQLRGGEIMTNAVMEIVCMILKMITAYSWTSQYAARVGNNTRSHNEQYIRGQYFIV